jgi:hypothetical protein
VNTAAEIRTIKNICNFILSPHTRLDILIRWNPQADAWGYMLSPHTRLPEICFNFLRPSAFCVSSVVKNNNVM